ncbi:MAG: PH domain-containing protein [Acidimicrobiales bacterium]
MSFPKKLLAPGEEIYLDSRPNWSYLFWPVVITALVFAACVAVAVVWSSAPTVMAWVLLGCGLCACVYLGARYIGWRTKSFVVTSQRIVYRTGALRRTGREIPIGRVQDVTYHQTIVERLVRAGSLTVESAGRQGQDPFPDITRPAEVQSLINRVVVQATTGQWLAPRPTASGPGEPPEFADEPASPPPPPVTDPTPRISPLGVDSAPRPALSANAAQRLRRLTDLYQQGVITDSEYEEKCREVLGGS